MKVVINTRKKKRKPKATEYSKSFGKWKQTRYSDGIQYPVKKYNLNDEEVQQ